MLHLALEDFLVISFLLVAELAELVIYSEDATLFIPFLIRPLIFLSTSQTSNIIFPGALFSPQTVHFVFHFALIALLHRSSA